LTAESPNVRSDVHVGDPRTSKVVYHQVDHRPQVGLFVSVQLEHSRDMTPWDDQHVTGCDREVVRE
jgi:hypothetical protein